MTKTMKTAFKFILAIAVSAACLSCSGEDPYAGPAGIPVPEDVVIIVNDGSSLGFSWKEEEGVLNYVARLENADGSLFAQQNPVEPRAVFNGVSYGAVYIFKVRSRTSEGTSDYSEPLSAVAGEGLPDPGPGPEPSGEYAEFAIPAHEDLHGGVLAFPGAEGGGMYTSGGRGGKVIHVTTLEDSGPGSLRAAVEASGARTVVFDVAGIISLKSKLRIRNGDLTIAGQTAPGDGICIRNYSTVVDADNVIIRYVRFRLGDEGANADDGEDAVWGRYHSDIILDHCSMSWSIDECASFYANRNFTMQWCILTESLRHSVHGKGNHGYGGIWGGRDASFHHNMLANHDSRNPRFDHPEIYGGRVDTHRGHVDYRNNAVYNWGSNSTYGGEGAWFNMVGNYYKPGQASRDRKYFLDANGLYTSSNTDYGYPVLYLNGNVHTGYADITADNSTGIYWHDHKTNTVPSSAEIVSAVQSLYGPSGEDIYTTTHDAGTAFKRIIEAGGASLRRDSVDERACNDAEKGTPSFNDGGNGSTGGLVDTQSAVGGWPSYEADASELAMTQDSDGDGMPDWFEDKFGLDRSDASDGNKKTLDIKGRYTNLEMYLHYIVREIVEKQNEAGTYTKIS